MRKIAHVNQALHELLKERIGLNDEDLRIRICEIL